MNLFWRTKRAPAAICSANFKLRGTLYLQRTKAFRGYRLCSGKFATWSFPVRAGLSNYKRPVSTQWKFVKGEKITCFIFLRKTNITAYYIIKRLMCAQLEFKFSAGIQRFVVSFNSKTKREMLRREQICADMSASFWPATKQARDREQTPQQQQTNTLKLITHPR